MSNKLFRAITSFSYLSQGIVKRLSRFIKDDKIYLSLRYYALYGRSLNWRNPTSFSEKMQWLKLYNRKPEYVIMADKILAKAWVSERIGKDYIIPTLGIWDNADDVDFNSLPNRFVIKCNHNSGTGMYICRDKTKMNVLEVREGLRKGLQEDYYSYGREWPYRDIPRRIIAEQFMEDSSSPGDLADYKFFCFNGEPRFCQVIRDRSTKETIDIYDMEWNLMPFRGLNPHAFNGSIPVEKPLHLEQMKSICRKLSENMPFVRIDLYVINGREYFGEITFFPMNGFGTFIPVEWNKKMGDLINLNK